MFDEFDVGKVAILGKVINFSSNIENDMAVDDFWLDVIFFHDII